MSEHPEALSVVSTASERLPREPTPHGDRFRVAVAVLGGIAVLAVVLAVAIAIRGGHSSTTSSSNWSTWSPADSGSSGVEEIADYVAPFYRLTASKQLDVISPIELTDSDDAGEVTGSGLTVAVNTATSSSSQSLSLLSGKTVAYNICGTGKSNCALAGTPSPNRLLLLRREALELALYTLKYINGTENVVVVLPPGRASTGTTTDSEAKSTKPVTVVALFDRTELQPLLNVPLDDSLATYPPSLSELSAWSTTDEAELVSEATAHGLFSEQIESEQEGGTMLVLTQLPSQ